MEFFLVILKHNLRKPSLSTNSTHSQAAKSSYSDEQTCQAAPYGILPPSVIYGLQGKTNEKCVLSVCVSGWIMSTFSSKAYYIILKI